MPKLAVPLNDTKIKALKPKAKRYMVADGGGLVLEVMTSGAKIWRYRYSMHGKQQPLVTIGDYSMANPAWVDDLNRLLVRFSGSGVCPDTYGPFAIPGMRCWHDIAFRR